MAKWLDEIGVGETLMLWDGDRQVQRAVVTGRYVRPSGGYALRVEKETGGTLSIHADGAASEHHDHMLTHWRARKPTPDLLRQADEQKATRDRREAVRLCRLSFDTFTVDATREQVMALHQHIIGLVSGA